MNDDFYLRFESLSKELDYFYNKEYSSENESYLENKKIKSKIVSLILESNGYDEIQLIDKALLLLFDNTGCQEDFEILNEVIYPLLDEKIITKELFEKNLSENSPLSRWC
ncbi:hypothetical protein [Xenorhabdus bovienii]|uniref:Uncharacterized protein n=1 Tax=Xenorhabdus bovienii str. kraussei Becker Underwood TaxID=1398204 RepID=A0A077PYY5_XENBV|nr:hypothetical protein [Xenorhabdus bovienii]CDH26418.1 conserved hypothetical protein [Xenorhabdus bovienii str. kraussei Becker Underwood]